MALFLLLILNPAQNEILVSNGLAKSLAIQLSISFKIFTFFSIRFLILGLWEQAYFISSFVKAPYLSDLPAN